MLKLQAVFCACSLHKSRIQNNSRMILLTKPNENVVVAPTSSHLYTRLDKQSNDTIVIQSISEHSDDLS